MVRSFSQHRIVILEVRNYADFSSDPKQLVLSRSLNVPTFYKTDSEPEVIQDFLAWESERVLGSASAVAVIAMMSTPVLF